MDKNLSKIDIIEKLWGGHYNKPKKENIGKKEIRFIELFAGVGGFRLGLEGANDTGPQRIQQGKGRGGFRNSAVEYKLLGAKQFHCVWANEIDKYACQVYRKRFGNKELLEGDIREVPSPEIPDHDLLCAGFPCQSFSIAGKREGFQDLTRGTLFFEIIRILRDKRPKYLLLENVKGLLSSDSGRTFAIILLSLDELRYDVEWFVANTKYYLPQNRERVFIFGTRKGS